MISPPAQSSAATQPAPIILGTVRTGDLNVYINALGEVAAPPATAPVTTRPGHNPVEVAFAIPEESAPPIIKDMDAGRHPAVEVINRDWTKMLGRGSLAGVDNQFDDTTGTLRCRALVTPLGDALLFPNQFVNVRLRIETKRGVTFVPQSAVLWPAPHSRPPVVYVISPDQIVSARPVTLGAVGSPAMETGLTNGQDVEIISGLSPGETIVVDGAAQLHDGESLPANARLAAATRPATQPAATQSVVGSWASTSITGGLEHEQSFDRLDMHPDGTYVMDGGPPEPITFEGNYQLDGSRITFTRKDYPKDRIQGRFDGDRLTFWAGAGTVIMQRMPAQPTTQPLATQPATQAAPTILGKWRVIASRGDVRTLEFLENGKCLRHEAFPDGSSPRDYADAYTVKGDTLEFSDLGGRGSFTVTIAKLTADSLVLAHDGNAMVCTREVPTVPANATQPATQPAAPTILGKWRVVGGKGTGNMRTLEFLENGKCLRHEASPDGSDPRDFVDSYSVKAETLQLSAPGRGQIALTIAQLTNNTLMISAPSMTVMCAREVTTVPAATQPATATAPAAITEAASAAESWLKLLDAGKYDETWRQLAVAARKAVTQADWSKSLAAARTPLGKVLSRKLTSAQVVTTLPGAPDGHYVILQYQTDFANKKAAVETVTPMKDPDGRWRVSGYYVK